MKKLIKITFIIISVVVVIGLGFVFMIIFDPNAQSFSELFHDWFCKQERVIEVYPFDITCIEDTTSKGGREDFALIYNDPKVREGRTITIYVDKADYDTLRTIYTTLTSCDPQSADYQQGVVSAKAFHRKIVYDNYPIIYQCYLYTDSIIKKNLSDIDNVQFY